MCVCVCVCVCVYGARTYFGFFIICAIAGDMTVLNKSLGHVETQHTIVRGQGFAVWQWQRIVKQDLFYTILGGSENVTINVRNIIFEVETVTIFQPGPVAQEVPTDLRPR